MDTISQRMQSKSFNYQDNSYFHRKGQKNFLLSAKENFLPPNNSKIWDFFFKISSYSIWPYLKESPEKAMAPPQYSCLENPTDRGAWCAAVYGVAQSQTGLSDFTFTFLFHVLEKAVAPHSSVLAWRIPRTAEPGGLPSVGSHRVGHDWSDLAAAAAALRW